MSHYQTNPNPKEQHSVNFKQKLTKIIQENASENAVYK